MIQVDRTRTGKDVMAQFVVVTTFTSPNAPDPFYPAHREFLDRLASQGTLLLAGPFADGAGGLLILEARDEEAVRGILADDPYATGGVFADLDVRPFRAIAGTWHT